MGYFANAGQILINFAFGALIALVMSRVLLQLVRANFYNPICQFLYKLTNPVMMPLHRFIPNWRNLDIAGVLVALILTAIKLALLYAVFGQGLGLLGLVVMAIADLINFVREMYIVVILVRVVMSFISVERSNPVVPLVYQLTEPVLQPIRRRIPALGGLDFSPALAMLVLFLMQPLIVLPLLNFGMRLAQAV
jgi:YggT family protein